ncbi:MAG: enoyl-CoA hydratase-related protein [Hydrogenophaga sp.]|uniref:enoyl-CoA hydratase/isomerase family protein n=1 Tax=Hydrogenophaga sp. TaxID=1904254 RepID=UPI00271D3EC0|nr:enoyl-CoA hydratase-related protein [Hydrogenophaga sp.]MDO9480962.1 enoyl-CoA hydratase-related protein [Hydrogenophaga sp.]MDP2221971.1 enoyl-CoA hydratase-related protein [Hydrogenophaga sp.]MDP3345343.1 enoyl-CoA hydratase-related protein [Hydrogenophaga sp.]MDP3807703.1 enoyl-CoA hydratase-related protein [Hydrogenophaga sp.]
MTDDNILQIEEAGGIARITLNRPHRLNALNPALATALREYFQGLQRRLAVRVVILQAAGAQFCAGLDLKEQEPGEDIGTEAMMAVQHSIRDIMIAMRRCPQPVIGVIQGAASGGGFALALACDVRLATPDARLNASFIRIGLTGCDMGVSYFLPRMVGSSVAAEYLLTGRFMNAQRALALGLFSQVAPLADLQRAAQSLADDMLRNTPLGLRLTKEGLGHAIDASSLDAVIALEDRQQVLCSQSGDFREGLAAFLEKRTPQYRNT